MTKYLEGSFSVFPGSSKSYRDNYDKVFGKKENKPVPDETNKLPAPRDAQPAPEMTIPIPRPDGIVLTQEEFDNLAQRAPMIPNKSPVLNEKPKKKPKNEKSKKPKTKK